MNQKQINAGLIIVFLIAITLIVTFAILEYKGKHNVYTNLGEFNQELVIGYHHTWNYTKVYRVDMLNGINVYEYKNVIIGNDLVAVHEDVTILGFTYTNSEDKFYKTNYESFVKYKESF